MATSVGMRIVRGALLTTALAAPPLLAVAWALAGGKGVLGAASGLALAAAFLAVTAVVVEAVWRAFPDLVFAAVIGTFILKLTAVGLGVAALRDTTAFNRTAFVLAVLVGVCAYLAAEVVVVSRARIPYVEPGKAAGAGERKEVD